MTYKVQLDQEKMMMRLHHIHDQQMEEQQEHDHRVIFGRPKTRKIAIHKSHIADNTEIQDHMFL